MYHLGCGRLSALFLSIVGYVNAQSGIQCTALAATLDEKVYYQALPAELFNHYYTAQQSNIRPLCLVLPTSAEDISLAIKIINSHPCVFAVKSGGHAMFAGASNAENGITFDMRNLNGLGISDDRETAFVGTGNRWGDVYDYLDQWNLTAVGGRDASVGVGGFLLGGGISFISRKYGWGADNVRNYEVVLANGSIAEVNQITHPDLYWALRGGGNNFGIVTRFDLETHPLVPMWGGFGVIPLGDLNTDLEALGLSRTFSSSASWIKNKVVETIFSLLCRFGFCTTMETFADLLERLAIDGSSDPYAQAYTVLCMMPYINNWLWALQLNHGQGNPTAPAFGDLVHLKTVRSTNRLANSTSFAKEIAAYNSRGWRVTYRTATFKFDKALVKEIMKICVAELDPIRYTKNLIGGLPLMLITKDEISHFSKNGGNALGLEEGEGPLLLINLSFLWKMEADDEVVMGAAKRITDRSVALAKEMGLHHRFIYQNYAARDQDVFEGYGQKNRERLRAIQQKYDPEGVFSKLNPGYFKV